MKHLEVYSKNVYGVLRIYPHNAEAHDLARLLGKKTFSENDLVILKRLGYEIKQVLENELHIPEEE